MGHSDGLLQIAGFMRRNALRYRDRTAYVCGSPGFCDAATDVLIASRWTAGQIRVERFGPTG